MTSPITTLDFSAILLKTRTLMIALTALQKGMLEDGIESPRFVAGLDYDPATAEGAYRFLEHVEFALDLIGTTFNASLNHEGLAAFNDIVHQVDRALQEEWVQEILAKTLYGPITF
jgi:hypothetical protein